MNNTRLETGRNRRWFHLIGIMVIAVSLAAIPAVQTIIIDVSPNVLNLQNKGSVVTVHTDVAYGLVVKADIYLNTVLIQSWKADDRGNFVAKFNMDDVKGLPLTIGSYNELTMKGFLTTGDEFTGSQEILVINNIPRK
jgi:hypothetical protein